MIIYIINFVLCSGLLLLVYRVFLGYENLYRFNRFYLLFSLVFSLVVPFITIGVQHIKVPVIDQQIISQTVSAVVNNPVHRQAIHQPAIISPVHPEAVGQPVINGPVHQEATSQSVPVHQQILQTPKHNYLPGSLLAIYFIVTLVMLSRFGRNSYRIGRVVAKNATVPYQDVKLVLLDEDITPHSFLKYIFINKSDYQNGLIEPEIICHEQTHVKQLHSLDVIVVELLQAICWFNPFIPFYRRAMQLNHEFLADEAVVKNYEDTPAYQYLLLSKAGQRGSLYLTSQFNYLATKKRLIMMTKSTSAKMALYKKLALAPLIIYALLLFCNKGIAQTSRAAVKSAYKNMAIAMDKISLAIDPALEKPIANKLLATENNTNTQLRDVVSEALANENAENSAKLQQRIILTDTSARKLPNVQQGSLRAPADIKIDGKATEWNNRFQAYNDTIHIYYTIANDDKNLYLTVQASDRGIIRMIMVNGVSFTIDRLKRVRKDLLNNYYPSITYPTREKENGTYGYGVYVDSSEAKLRTDLFAVAYNKHLAADSKYIRVTGIRTLAELTLINNRGGIKVASTFDNKMVYTYELAVDLSLLGLDAAKSEQFDYNIAVGEGPVPELSRTPGVKLISRSWTAQPDDPYNPHGYIPADFWGEYTLAK